MNSWTPRPMIPLNERNGERFSRKMRPHGEAQGHPLSATCRGENAGTWVPGAAVTNVTLTVAEEH